jgi:hypothetical protein
VEAWWQWVRAAGVAGVCRQVMQRCSRDRGVSREAGSGSGDAGEGVVRVGLRGGVW